MAEHKLCENCKFSKYQYSDGYILRTMHRYTGNVEDLPKEPDNSKFCTYWECSKNNKKLQYLNLDGKCPVFMKKDT